MNTKMTHDKQQRMERTVRVVNTLILVGYSTKNHLDKWDYETFKQHMHFCFYHAPCRGRDEILEKDLMHWRPILNRFKFLWTLAKISWCTVHAMRARRLTETAGLLLS